MSETPHDLRETSPFTEVIQLLADVNLVYPERLQQVEAHDGVRVELVDISDPIIAGLVRKNVEYTTRFASGKNDDLFNRPVNPALPAEAIERSNRPMNRERYKFIALSVLLSNGTLDESALGSVFGETQGAEFSMVALREAVSIIAEYAKYGDKSDPRMGGTGLH